MEPTQGKQSDPTVRFFEDGQELAEQEFLAKYPDPSALWTSIPPWIGDHGPPVASASNLTLRHGECAAVGAGE